MYAFQTESDIQVFHLALDRICLFPRWLCPTFSLLSFFCFLFYFQLTLPFTSEVCASFGLQLLYCYMKGSHYLLLLSISFHQSNSVLLLWQCMIDRMKYKWPLLRQKYTVHWSEAIKKSVKLEPMTCLT